MKTPIKYCRLLLLALLFAFLSSEVPAQKKKKRIIYRKKTKIDFSDAIIEGRGANPEGVYVVTPPKSKPKSLLKLRPNFHKELIRDTLLLR